VPEAQRGRPDWSKYPPWVLYVPGLLGAAWLIGGFSWFLWARVLPADTTLLATVTQGGICVSGIAFGIAGLWPIRGQGKVRPSEIGDFWAFVRGPSPSVAHLRALHTKYRVSLAIVFVFFCFMVAHGLVTTLGLAVPE